MTNSLSLELYSHKTSKDGTITHIRFLSASSVEPLLKTASSLAAAPKRGGWEDIIRFRRIY